MKLQGCLPVSWLLIAAVGVCGCASSDAAAPIPWIRVDPPVASGFFTGGSADAQHELWLVGWDVKKGVDGGLYRYSNGTWRRVPQPMTGGVAVRLFQVDAVHQNDVWAVGGVPSESGVSVVARWDGSKWTVDRLAHHDIQSVAGVPGTGTAWAVGGTTTAPVALFLNGASWRRKSLPAGGRSLGVVVAVSPDSAWAVGESATGGGLVEHWNGHAWFNMPDANAPDETTQAISYVPKSPDVWVVGNANQKPDGTTQPFAELWNGTGSTLKRTPIPTLAHGGTLYGVTARSTTDAWAVGTSGGSFLVEHWNGKTWARVSIANGPEGSSVLTVATAVPGSDEVWAAGDTTRGVNHDAPAVFQHGS